MMQFILWMMFVGLSAPLSALTIEKFSVSNDSIKINDPLNVELHLQMSAPFELEPLKDFLRGKLLESGNFFLIGEQVDNKGNLLTFRWTLEPLKEGYFPISFYQIELPASKLSPVFSPVKYVTVETFETPLVLPPAPLLPLKPYIPPELSLENQSLIHKIQAKQPKRNVNLFLSKKLPWLSLLAALFAVLLAPFFLLYLKSRKRKKVVLLPSEAALQSLEKLESKNYLKPQDFVVDMTQVLREFIQDKYNLKAPYLTTEEFLKQAADHDLLKESGSEKLTIFLKAADQVKFAGKTPSKSELNSAFNFAKAYLTNAK